MNKNGESTDLFGGSSRVPIQNFEITNDPHGYQQKKKDYEALKNAIGMPGDYSDIRIKKMLTQFTLGVVTAEQTNVLNELLKTYRFDLFNQIGEEEKQQKEIQFD